MGELSGIVPEACSTWFLPRLVGIAQAAEWVYTGRVFGAEEARAGALVSRVVAPDGLLPAARELPEHVQRVQPVGLCRVIRRPREGGASFLEKRPPRFTLRPSKDMPPFYPWWRPREFK